MATRLKHVALFVLPRWRIRYWNAKYHAGRIPSRLLAWLRDPLKPKSDLIYLHHAPTKREGWAYRGNGPPRWYTQNDR